MGAKIGKRVYWPGSGIYCPDPELLEIGDNVIFGSRSFLITTDRLGSGKIKIEDGGKVILWCYNPIILTYSLAMIADRVVLLPHTRVGSGAVMGSGSLGKRGATYNAYSTWMGNGEIPLLSDDEERIIDQPIF